MFRRRKSLSPASSNYDFSLRHERVKLFEKMLKQFDANISRTIKAMQDVAASLSLVGQSYHEVAQCVNNTNPQSVVNRAYSTSSWGSKRVVENYGAHLQSAATVFAGEMRSLREGEHYVAFNGGVHHTVLARLHEVMTHAKKTCELGDDVMSALCKSVAAKKIVEKKKAKYARLGKPLTESKRYTKQSEKARQWEQSYESKLRTFDSEYEGLMQRQLYVAGLSMDNFLDVNTVYLAQILKVLSCLAPHGADAVEEMVNTSQDLGCRLGIAPEDQVSSRFRPRIGNATPNNATKNVTPMRSTPGKAASHNESSHNFTSYYCNYKKRDPSADQAPPTARALDDSEGRGAPAAVAASTNYWSTPGASQEQVLSSFPQGRIAGLSEPHPSPPQLCAHPMAQLPGGWDASAESVASGVRRGGNTVMPVVPRSSDARIHKPMEGVAAASTKPSTSTGTNGQASSPPSTTTEGVMPSTGHAPFGSGNTPAPLHGVQRPPSPPAVIPPTKVSPTGHSDRRATALQTQGALLGLDRARSVEPFDDDCPTGVVSYTARSTLQPVNLMPAMEEVADRSTELQRGHQPGYVNPLALGSGATHHRTQPRLQKHDLKTTRRSTTVPVGLASPSLLPSAPQSPSAVAAAPLLNARTAPTVASAPPPDDATLSSSTNSHFLGNSVANSVQDSLSFGYGQHNATNVHNVNPHRLATPAGVKSHSNGDGWESETGGVTGRSHALSTSYALDSPAYAPHLRGMEQRGWERSGVRACSPA
ncbi:hypothetical protein ABL78_3481 [Leptomonas seymouri]|uniref:BAR domain-containing protein n=1 Tax=Leptomonas seymouri TaxID=5684 RepID=A0A0N1I4R4_LEPSE|nr:hypothetical protein ABL78_3481 [Leptomonas seymouri]|eukprot:KPI87450.1 hypothetical protein ABL78_3481 [Leptomonas seymouri]